ncbi:class I SAM-dependent methyltransferase [Actinopolymorpha sp. NPDC004070]|uniref:class I SAM-dependent methyltransferase n=1 Tax=Actinopolymorpha sp. NPDC004070 TaxID=3154548 RepID=UPI0033B489D4
MTPDATALPAADRGVLTGEEYADAGRLSDRISVYAWQRPRLDLGGAVLARLRGLPGPGPVLDVGWGTGALTRRLRADRPDLRVIPVDLSAGLRPEVVGEVDRLPFAGGSVGAALAMHMLYYAAEPANAVRELRRVLRPGGRLVASTNAAGDKPQWARLWTDTLRDLGVTDPPPYDRGDSRFDLEIGTALVREVFGAVEVHDHRYEIAVPGAGPVLAYLHSTRGQRTRALPKGLTWADFRSAASDRIRAEIDRAGAFVLTGHTGILTAVA